jgi:hypothetical protein
MRLAVLVYRHEGIGVNLPRLVSADVPNHTRPTGLRRRITAAVTEWAKAGSESARTVMGYAGDDFNIGDLVDCLEDADLVACLKRQGVENLTIEEPSADDAWTYDTPLVDASVFEEDD